MACDLMTTPAITISPDESVAEAARVMAARHIGRLPVVSAAGRLVGIVSRSDLVSMFGRAGP
jgi:CBS domain-containing protein